MTTQEFNGSNYEISRHTDYMKCHHCSLTANSGWLVNKKEQPFRCCDVSSDGKPENAFSLFKLKSVKLNAYIKHELDAYIDDKRLLNDATDDHNPSHRHIAFSTPSKQRALSLRKREIRASLKKEWLKFNSSHDEDDFERWLFWAQKPGNCISNQKL